MTIQRWVNAFTVVLLVGFLLAGSGWAGVAAPKNGTPIEGTISVVEKDGTVAIVTAGGQAVVAYVNHHTIIYRGGKPAMLSDLQSGDQVQGKYAPDRTLLEIHARPSGASSATMVLEGALAGKEVDGTMVIVTADKAPVAVYADEKTKITINGNRADFPHLDRGDWVRIEVGADRRVAEVRAYTYDPRRPENVTTIQGTVSAMMMSGSVAIANKDTAVVVHLTDDSRITRNGKPVAREKIFKGSRVWAKYGPDRGVLELRILGS